MDLVGGDRLPLPAPADDDPQVTLTPHHPAGHICADRRVVDRFRRKGPDVLDLVADGAEVAGQRALEHEAGVVRPDHDAHRVSPGCFMTPTGSGLHDRVAPGRRRRTTGPPARAPPWLGARCTPVRTGPSGRRRTCGSSTSVPLPTAPTAPSRGSGPRPDRTRGRRPGPDCSGIVAWAPAGPSPRPASPVRRAAGGSHHPGCSCARPAPAQRQGPVSYTHLRAHETVLDLVCRLLLEK